MARMKDLRIAADDLMDDFLHGRFLEQMRLYGVMAETSNPATLAADRLHTGQSAEIPGGWIGPDYYGLTVRLQAGQPPEIVEVVQ